MNIKLGKWYVLYVRSRQEKKVYSLLMENEIESFLPMTETIRTWSDRKKKIRAPLFKSYVFVKIKSARDLHESLAIDGACSYINFANQYAVVQDHEIEMIKLVVGMSGDVKLTTPYELPMVGEIKKINRGPLEGRECEILNVNNQNKIIVRIRSIQQNILAKVPINYLYGLPETA